MQLHWCLDIVPWHVQFSVTGIQVGVLYAVLRQCKEIFAYGRLHKQGVQPERLVMTAIAVYIGLTKDFCITREDFKGYQPLSY